VPGDLVGQVALADSRLAADEDEPSPPRDGGVEHVEQLPKLSIAADERAALAPVAALRAFAGAVCDLKRRELVPEPVDDQLEDAVGTIEVLQLVLAEVT
jgi:hypothetical protein